jgi:hypothetical protein
MRISTSIMLLAFISTTNAAEVQLAEVSETRTKQVIQDESSFPASSALNVKLRISGEDVIGATAYGQLSITEAIDDVGTNLKPKESGFFAERFQPIHRFGMMHGDDQKQEEPKHFDLDVQLQAPPRKATRIKSLKGDVQVQAGGEKKTITLTNIASQYGKQVQDPALKDAGVTITVVDPKAGQTFASSDAITLQVKGNVDVITGAEITNAASERISFGSFSSGFNDEKTIGYDLTQPLDEKVTMKLNLLVNQKTVKVPFELKDVELP